MAADRAVPDRVIDMAREVWDAIVIGSGAGGGPLALVLSQAGLRVLVLEKGPRYDADRYEHDELLTDDASGFFVPRVADDPHVLVRTRDGHTRRDLTTLGWIASCVGGGTVHMGGTLYRGHPDDFRLRTLHGGFLSIEDWPYSYEDLEPYYTRAEWEVGVSGSDARTWPAGRRSGGYPMPPLPCHPLGTAFDTACAALGTRAFVTPRAINSVPYRGRPACRLCSACAGFGCAIGAKGSTQDALLPRAEATGRCEVRANVMVRQITIAPTGRADGCRCLDADGREHDIQARIVCVCCSAVESARLLLLSTSRLFPDGLANGSGQVGRHCQFHVTSGGRGRFWRTGGGVSREPDRLLSRSVADHYFLPPGVSTWAAGGLLRFDLMRPYPIAAAQSLAKSLSAWPVYGTTLKRHLVDYFRDCREVEFEVFQPFVPNPGTFVTLDPDVVDRHGLPVARITLAQVEHHARAGEWLAARGLDILTAMGADHVLKAPAGALSHVMVHGTCRAGTDPRASVLNAFCQSHEVPNLFVVDGSFMPSCGGVPSTLTILANSFRTADYILEAARHGSLN
jgi:choline dehydrogenase-like flavoprotein